MEVVVVVDNVGRGAVLPFSQLLLCLLDAIVPDANGAAAEENEEPAPVDRVVVAAVIVVVSVIRVVRAVTVIVVIVAIPKHSRFDLITLQAILVVALCAHELR